MNVYELRQRNSYGFQGVYQILGRSNMPYGPIRIWLTHAP